MDRDSAVQCLEEGREQYRRRVAIRSVALLCLFGFFSVLLWKSGNWGIAMVALALAVFQILLIILPMDDTDRLLELVRDDPARVVWIYPVEWAISPFGVHLFRRCYLKVHFDNGSIVDLRIPPLDTYGWMRCLNVLFPETAFGYTEERRAEFERWHR